MSIRLQKEVSADHWETAIVYNQVKIYLVFIADTSLVLFYTDENIIVFVSVIIHIDTYITHIHTLIHIFMKFYRCIPSCPCLYYCMSDYLYSVVSSIYISMVPFTSMV